MCRCMLLVCNSGGEVVRGHPHAELMAQYAEESKTDPCAWGKWQVKTNATWGSLICIPRWDTTHQYRRKPDPVVLYVNVYESGTIVTYETEAECRTAAHKAVSKIARKVVKLVEEQ